MNTQALANFLRTKTGLTIFQFFKFACIGLLNTALNFLILNAISKAMGIDKGVGLAVIDYFSFSMAVIQSYLWNRTWTFGGEQDVRLLKDFFRLVLVGALGAIAIIFVLVGSKYSQPWYYYAGVLAIYLVIESLLWRRFGFHMSNWNHEGHSFAIFFVVTFVGLNINAWLTAFFSVHIELTQTVDLNKNIAVVLATCISLFWNFIGYKVLVFKK